MATISREKAAKKILRYGDSHSNSRLIRKKREDGWNSHFQVDHMPEYNAEEDELCLKSEFFSKKVTRKLEEKPPKFGHGKTAKKVHRLPTIHHSKPQSHSTSNCKSKAISRGKPSNQVSPIKAKKKKKRKKTILDPIVPASSRKQQSNALSFLDQPPILNPEEAIIECLSNEVLRSVEHRESLKSQLDVLVQYWPVIPRFSPKKDLKKKKGMSDEAVVLKSPTRKLRMLKGGLRLPPPNSDQAKDMLTNFASELQLAGIHVVEKTVRWMLQVGKDDPNPPIFYYRKQNYFQKMVNDSNALYTQFHERGVKHACYRRMNPIFLSKNQGLKRARAAHTAVEDMLQTWMIIEAESKFQSNASPGINKASSDFFPGASPSPRSHNRSPRNFEGSYLSPKESIAEFSTEYRNRNEIHSLSTTESKTPISFPILSHNDSNQEQGEHILVESKIVDNSRQKSGVEGVGGKETGNNVNWEDLEGRKNVELETKLVGDSSGKQKGGNDTSEKDGSSARVENGDETPEQDEGDDNDDDAYSEDYDYDDEFEKEDAAESVKMSSNAEKKDLCDMNNEKQDTRESETKDSPGESRHSPSSNAIVESDQRGDTAGVVFEENPASEDVGELQVDSSVSQCAPESDAGVEMKLDGTGGMYCDTESSFNDEKVDYFTGENKRDKETYKESTATAQTVSPEEEWQKTEFDEISTARLSERVRAVVQEQFENQETEARYAENFNEQHSQLLYSLIDRVEASAQQFCEHDTISSVGMSSDDRNAMNDFFASFTDDHTSFKQYCWVFKIVIDTLQKEGGTVSKSKFLKNPVVVFHSWISHIIEETCLPILQAQSRFLAENTLQNDDDLNNQSNKLGNSDDEDESVLERSLEEILDSIMSMYEQDVSPDSRIFATESLSKAIALKEVIFDVLQSSQHLRALIQWSSASLSSLFEWFKPYVLVHVHSDGTNNEVKGLNFYYSLLRRLNWSNIINFPSSFFLLSPHVQATFLTLTLTDTHSPLMRSIQTERIEIQSIKKKVFISKRNSTLEDSICEMEELLECFPEIEEHQIQFEVPSYHKLLTLQPYFLSEFGEKFIDNRRVEEGDGVGLFKEWFHLAFTQLKDRFLPSKYMSLAAEVEAKTIQHSGSDEMPPDLTSISPCTELVIHENSARLQGKMIGLAVNVGDLLEWVPTEEEKSNNIHDDDSSKSSRIFPQLNSRIVTSIVSVNCVQLDRISETNVHLTYQNVIHRLPTTPVLTLNESKQMYELSNRLKPTQETQRKLQYFSFLVHLAIREQLCIPIPICTKSVALSIFSPVVKSFEISEASSERVEDDGISNKSRWEMEDMLEHIHPELYGSIVSIRLLSQTDQKSILVLDSYTPSIEGSHHNDTVESYIRAKVKEALIPHSHDTDSWQHKCIQLGRSLALSSTVSLSKFFRSFKDVSIVLDMLTTDPSSEVLSVRSRFQVVADSTFRKNSEFQRVFWGIVDSFSRSEQLEFIKFVTGTPTYPLKGKEFLRIEMPFTCFNAKDAQRQIEQLPTSHTCDNILEIPDYWNSMLAIELEDGRISTKLYEELSKKEQQSICEKVERVIMKKLRTAILYGNEGYGLDSFNSSIPDPRAKPLHGPLSNRSKDADLDDIIQDIPTLDSDTPHEIPSLEFQNSAEVSVSSSRGNEKPSLPHLEQRLQEVLSFETESLDGGPSIESIPPKATQDSLNSSKNKQEELLRDKQYNVGSDEPRNLQHHKEELFEDNMALEELSSPKKSLDPHREDLDLSHMEKSLEIETFINDSTKGSQLVTSVSNDYEDDWAEESSSKIQKQVFQHTEIKKNDVNSTNNDTDIEEMRSLTCISNESAQSEKINDDLGTDNLDELLHEVAVDTNTLKLEKELKYGVEESTCNTDYSANQHNYFEEKTGHEAYPNESISAITDENSYHSGSNKYVEDMEYGYNYNQAYATTYDDTVAYTEDQVSGYPVSKEEGELLEDNYDYDSYAQSAEWYQNDYEGGTESAPKQEQEVAKIEGDEYGYDEDFE